MRIKIIFSTLFILFYLINANAQYTNTVEDQSNSPVKVWQNIDLTGKQAKLIAHKFPWWTIYTSGALLGGGITTWYFLDKDEVPHSLPIANPDNFNNPCKSAATLDVLANDTGDEIKITSVQSPAGVNLVNEITNILMSNAGKSDFSFTYTITDKYGNMSTANVNVTVFDDNPPSIICPDDVDISCSEPYSTDNTGQATFSDNCSEVTNIQIKHNDDASGLTGPNGTGTLLRQWTAIDEAGNKSECTQSINIKDINAPEINCPPEISIHCDQTPSPDITGLPEVSDDCSPKDLLKTEHTDDESGLSDSGTGVLIRYWYAEDESGKKSNCEQSISIFDDEVPTVKCPDEVTIRCDQENKPEATGYPVVSDNCTPENSIDVDYTDDISGLSNIDGTGVLLRNWKVTDIDGNTSECEQNINIKDDEVPVISCPPDQNILCDQSHYPDITGKATATDNCTDQDMLNISYKDDPEYPDGCNGTGDIVRTWTATDASSNSSECKQMIIIRDNVNPTIQCPENISILSNQGIDPDVTGYPEYHDNCSLPENMQINYEDDLSQYNGIEGTIIRHWTAIDACGNASTCEQIIIVENIPCNIEVQFNIKHPDCGFDNGSIKAEYEPGLDLEFLWSTGDLESGISGLGEGDYSLTITDLTANCQSVFDFTLIEQENIYIDYFVISGPDCPNGGEIELFFESPGSGVFNVLVTYSDTDYFFEGITGNFLNLSDLMPIKAGDYYITVYDVEAGEYCTQFLQLYVPEDIPFSLTLLFVNPPDNADMNNGSAGFGVPVSEVEMPLSIFLNGAFYATAWEPAFIVENLMPGEYSIYVTDANGCNSTIVGFEVPFSSGIELNNDIYFLTGWQSHASEISLIGESLFKPGHTIWNGEFIEKTSDYYILLPSNNFSSIFWEAEVIRHSKKSYSTGLSFRTCLMPTLLIETSENQISAIHPINFYALGISASMNKTFKAKRGKYGLQFRASVDKWKNLDQIPALFDFLKKEYLNSWTFAGIDLKGKYNRNIVPGLELQLESGIEFSADLKSFETSISQSFQAKFKIDLMQKLRTNNRK